MNSTLARQKIRSLTSLMLFASILTAPALVAPPAQAALPVGFEQWSIPSYVESFQVFARGGRGGLPARRRRRDGAVELSR